MSTDNELNRLLQLSRTAQAADTDETEIPFGFTTRVLARAWSGENENTRAWRFGLRWGLAGAAVLMFASMGLNSTVLKPAEFSADAVFHQQLVELVLP